MKNYLLILSLINSNFNNICQKLCLIIYLLSPIMSLGDNMYSVIFDTDAISDDVLQEIYKKMPLIRQKKADTLKKSVDRANCILAWSLLEDLLNQNGVNIYDYNYIIGDNGKPYLDGCPYYFSISHSNNAVIASVADSEVGVDIQYAVDDYDRVAKRVCTNNELMAIKDKYDFVRIWALKEATVKCLGTGIADLEKYDFSSKYDKRFLYDEYDGGEYYIVECKRAG